MEIIINHSWGYHCSYDWIIKTIYGRTLPHRCSCRLECEYHLGIFSGYDLEKYIFQFYKEIISKRYYYVLVHVLVRGTLNRTSESNKELFRKVACN